MSIVSGRVLWQRAAQLAARSHRHQLRRDGTTPYIAHPVRVLLTLAQVFGETDDTVLAAALLHDAIEDTACDFDDIEAACGADVASLVAALSKDKRLREDQREAAYAAQIAAADWRVRLIKLADVYDNLCDCMETNCGVGVWKSVEHALAAARGEARLTLAVQALESLVAEFSRDRPQRDTVGEEAESRLGTR